MNKIALPKQLKNRRGVRGKNRTPTIEEVFPFLPNEDCFFDIRHLVWGGVNDILPFSVTTRINANDQQWLKVTEYDKTTDTANMDERRNGYEDNI